MPRHIRMKHFTDGHTEEIITDSPPPGASAGRNPICECGELRCYHFGRVEYCTNDGFEKESGPTYRFSGKYALPASAGREEAEYWQSRQSVLAAARYLEDLALGNYDVPQGVCNTDILVAALRRAAEYFATLRSALAAERAAGEADDAVAEKIAHRIAARAVQNLADSEPSADTIEVQDRLAGTPQESLFCISAAELEAVIATTISDAVYDGELAARALAADRETK